ncbi:DUF302 domain-containing protein [Halohasta litorea]|uniref:DUF302 domain-containing protein n=1 Tax=Halohasta litorea TaxID=869891 RepID=A0ABD6D6V1_9EURY|nr:DUF302 domain-containing protein [Halohasta litorea]
MTDVSTGTDEQHAANRHLCTDGGSVDGLVTVASDASVDESVDRVKAAIDDIEGLSLMAEFDHAANAASVDRELLSTTVLVFGNPDIGTPLMQGNQTVAIDMPQKLLVAEHNDGTVTVSYNDPDYLAERHGIAPDHDTLETIAGALSSLAAVAAGEE